MGGQKPSHEKNGGGQKPSHEKTGPDNNPPVKETLSVAFINPIKFSKLSNVHICPIIQYNNNIN